jgi:Na+-transporting NADH:ubiquinone oxidoreductase subunit D
MSQDQKPLKTYLMDPFWNNNQILAAILGICSALAVTTSIQVSLTMGIAVTLVTGCSSFFVSLLRKVTPSSVRMITQLAVISTFVVIVNEMLLAFLYDSAKELSVYVGLIITNCLVMGRAEALARYERPIPAFLDGIGAGAGYAIVLLAVGAIRELFGFGTLLGYQMIPESLYMSSEHPNAYQNNGLFVTASSAFIILGLFIWISRLIKKEEDEA